MGVKTNECESDEKERNKFDEGCMEIFVESLQCYGGEIRRMVAFLIGLTGLKVYDMHAHKRSVFEYRRENCYP